MTPNPQFFTTMAAELRLQARTTLDDEMCENLLRTAKLYEAQASFTEAADLQIKAAE